MSYPALAAYVLAAPRPSAKPTSSSPHRGSDQLQEVLRRHVRQPEGGQAGVDVADDRDPVPVEVEDRHRGDAEQHGDQRAGQHRQPAPEPEHDREADHADGRVGPLVWPSRVRNVQACWKKSPSPFGTPDSLGTWPTMIVRARPTMKALEHRLGDEGGQEAEPEQAGEQREPAGDQGQRRGQRDVPVGAAGGEDRDRAGGQRRGGGHRSDDEVPGVPSAA
jgi:hypothetical protein